MTFRPAFLSMVPLAPMLCEVAVVTVAGDVCPCDLPAPSAPMPFPRRGSPCLEPCRARASPRGRRCQARVASLFADQPPAL